MLDELSAMGGALFGELSEKSRWHSKLGDALDAASELNFYVRKVEDEICASTFVNMLTEVLHYKKDE